MPHTPLSHGLPASFCPRTGIFAAGTALAEAGQLGACLLMSNVHIWGQRHWQGPHGWARGAGGGKSPAGHEHHSAGGMLGPKSVWLGQGLAHSASETGAAGQERRR